MAVRTGVVLDRGCLQHDMGRYHPETPKRLQVLLDLMTSSDAASLGCVPVDGRVASQADVTRVHSEAYYRRIMATQGRTVVLDMDTTACPRSFDAATRAAGATLAATEAVLTGEVSNAFALVRPPGHHAEPEKAMGFCLFNNVAIAARYAQKALKQKRVAIVDFDLHHGNGTQKVFWQDPSVLFVSTHQHPYYPGSGGAGEVGEGPGRGTTLNIPLAAGHGDQEYDAIYGGLVTRAVERFRPDLLLVSAGFDIFVGDPLGGMEVTAEGFARIAAHLRSLADRVCDGRVVFVLEGGYSLAGLRDGVLACLAALTHDGKLPRLEGDLEKLPMGDALRHLPAYRETFGL
jgi:acetoin utilization deacetylase AcuC-like enzyme